MKERPILFTDAMVRAIRDGRKTQTRRVCKGQRELSNVHDFQLDRCPFGQPGDRLWVRESWRIGAWHEDDGTFAIDYRASPELCRTPWVTIPDDHDGEKFNNQWIAVSDELDRKGIQPGADGRYRWEPGKGPLSWRRSIHMPRWASRITLEVTGVRVERLRDMTIDDVLAEGCILSTSKDKPRDFQNLWESINGAGSWGANPWVWVVQFKVVTP